MTSERDPGEDGDGSDPAWPVLESATEYETDWYDGGYDLVEQPDGTAKRYYWADLPDAVVVVALVDGSPLEHDRDGEAGRDDRDDETERDGETQRVGDRDGTTDSDDRVLFVEQYRPTIGETHLELPAGIVEDGESYTTAAARELEEETGFHPSSTALLQEYAVATGVLRHRRGIVYAEGLVPGERELDSNEFLEVRTVPVEDAIERGREAPTNDATLSGLLLAGEEGVL